MQEASCAESDQIMARLRATFSKWLGRASMGVGRCDPAPICSAEPNSTPATEDAPALESYQSKMTKEIERFKDVENVHDLPQIFHYWSNKFLFPMCCDCGFSGVTDLFASELYAAAVRSGNPKPQFISIGSGNCDLEVEVARLLVGKGLAEFSLECLELNPHMLARGKTNSENGGVADRLIFSEGDFNVWKPNKQYTSVMANHSLHHVVNLEDLFDGIKSSLEPAGSFVAADMIGRNGHQRWPEALAVLENFWQELPESYRYNRLLRRLEQDFMDWDCSVEGFEGIRAQDILPLLIERFDFSLFMGFANVVSPFVDRGFGHNFDATADWDRNFIDRVHAADEEGFANGRLKPTQMMAVMTPGPAGSHAFSRGISPAKALRDPRT